MKLELHCHTLGGSGCAKSSAEQIIKDYLSAGYNGVVVTNHYTKSCFEGYKGETKKEKLDFYFSLYDNLKELGEKQGLKVFLGAEVCVENQDDYLLFGFDRKLFYDNKPLFMLNQKEMFELAEKNGLLFAQAHPFRKGVKSVGNPCYMHGAERFNGHFHHVNNNDLAEKFCVENNLIGLSGTDYHVPNHPITAGIVIEDNVRTENELVGALFNRKFTIIKEEQKYLSEMKKFFENK